MRSISSFSELRANPSPSPGTFTVIVGSSANQELVDVLSTQSLPQFNGATFQAASNFNALEFTSQMQAPDDGVTDYIYDRTQGPYCALAAGAAVVFRNYFIPRPDGSRGQIGSQVELLGQTPIGRFVQNGYPILSKGALETVKDHNWEDLDQFLIAVHEDCQVTTSTRQNGALTTDPDVVPKDQIVHHIYVAALNFCGTVQLTPVSELIAKQLLKAEYQATVLAAWELSKKYPGRQGSNKLVLTAVGGGVFGNESAWIVEGIASAAEIIRQSGLDVYFVCYRQSDFTRAQEGGLDKVIQDLNGRKITQVSEL